MKQSLTSVQNNIFTFKFDLEIFFILLYLELVNQIKYFLGVGN